MTDSPFSDGDCHDEIASTAVHFAREIALFVIKLIDLRVEIDVRHVDVDVDIEFARVIPVTSVVRREVARRFGVVQLKSADH